jgi:hypothetical protein
MIAKRGTRMLWRVNRAQKTGRANHDRNSRCDIQKWKTMSDEGFGSITRKETQMKKCIKRPALVYHKLAQLLGYGEVLATGSCG